MDVIRGFRRLALRFSPANVTPKVSAYNAAVNYEIGLIAGEGRPADRPARLVRHGLSVDRHPGPSRAPARPGRGAGSSILTSLASLSR